MIRAVLKMPRLGETMQEGIIIGWLVAVGQDFVRGDPIVEVETDKSLVEFPALGDGRLKGQLVHQGDLVKVGDPIANIDIAGELDWTKEDEEPPKPVEEQLDQDGDLPTVAVTAVVAAPPSAKGHKTGPVRATPEARRLARHKGIELGTIHGSDRRGRIQKSDIMSALAANKPPRADNISFCHDIAYVSYGPAQGRPVLLVHGFGADHTSYGVLAALLARAGRRVYAIDLAGHGATRLQADDLADLSTNLVEFTTSIVGGLPFDLVAHSVGAVPAVALSARARVAPNSLTLIAPVGMGPEIDMNFIRSMAGPSSIDELARLLRRLSARHGALSPEALNALYRDLCRGRLRAIAADLAGPSGQRVDIIGALKKLAPNLPVSVLVGHMDKIINWRDVFLLPPGIGVHHFKDAGHMPHWDQPFDVAGIILQAGRK